MNYSPSIPTANDGCEAIQHPGSVLHEHPSETSGGSRDAVSSEAPPISSPCCIIDSFKETCRSDRVVLKIN